VATVLGVLLGSFLSAQVTRTFHWVAPANKGSFLSHLFGGLMMGYGAIISIGCNIGQGLTGCSVMALGGLITITFIVLGSWTAVGIRERMYG